MKSDFEKLTTFDESQQTMASDRTTFNYQEDLKRRQKEHLDAVMLNQQSQIYVCLHDQCPLCVGTGVKLDGTTCVHYISCGCPKCSPSY